MREILFKAKCLGNGEWIEGHLVKRDGIEEYYIIQDIYEQITNGQRYLRSNLRDECYRIDPSTVCQYTGLTDKNGVKIFESDLMRFDNGEEEFSDYAVDWSNASWKVACDDGSFPDNLDEFFSKRAEVIGNIHDKENDHEG